MFSASLQFEFIALDDERFEVWTTLSARHCGYLGRAKGGGWRPMATVVLAVDGTVLVILSDDGFGMKLFSFMLLI